MEDLQSVISKIKPCDRDRSYIFISYSSHDRDLVWRDVLEFQRRGYNVWLDEKNLDKTQASWKDDAIDAIEDIDCQLVVFYVSAHSLCSAACYKELSKTVEETTCAYHDGPLKFIAVDVEEIGDIMLFKSKVHRQIKENHELPKNTRQEQMLALNGFVRDFFNSNNEKVRIHPRNEADRKLDYYEDIIAAFPQTAKIYELSGEKIEEGTGSGESIGSEESISPGESRSSGVNTDSGKNKGPEGNMKSEGNISSGGNENCEENTDFREDVNSGRNRSDAGENADFDGGAAEETEIFADTAAEETEIFVNTAAEQEYADAQYELGNSYYYGQGLERDFKMAAECYRRAAEQGHAEARNRLGNCYYYGEGVSRNCKAAVEWYREAAERGIVNAQYLLGYCCYNGEGIPQDYEAAAKWYRKAAEQGNANAQNSLGDCYYYGNGVPQNYETAVKWYRKAAEQGHADAQNSLGECYKNGRGVPRDQKMAEKWYKKAEWKIDAGDRYDL